MTHRQKLVCAFDDLLCDSIVQRKSNRELYLRESKTCEQNKNVLATFYERKHQQNTLNLRVVVHTGYLEEMSTAVENTWVQVISETQLWEAKLNNKHTRQTSS